MTVVVSRPSGGRALSSGRPAHRCSPKISTAGPQGERTTDPLWPGEIGSKMALGFSEVFSLAHLHRLYFS